MKLQKCFQIKLFNVRLIDPRKEDNMKYMVSKLSNKGGRKQNEDNCDFTSYDDKHYLILADGLGGHSGGEIASKSAVEAAKFSLTNYDDILRAFEDANQAVLLEQEKDRRLKSMRTTLVLAKIQDYKLEFGHIGDSRLYIFKKNKVSYITPDHSVTYMLYKTGQIKFKQMRKNVDRNKLLRVLGDEDTFRPEIKNEIINLNTGDSILLCTDGFWEYINESEMGKLLKKSKSTDEWLVKLEKRILKRAKNDHDNYSAIAMFVD